MARAAGPASGEGQEGLVIRGNLGAFLAVFVFRIQADKVDGGGPAAVTSVAQELLIGVSEGRLRKRQPTGEGYYYPFLCQDTINPFHGLQTSDPRRLFKPVVCGASLNLKFLGLKFELSPGLDRFIDLQYSDSRFIRNFSGAIQFGPSPNCVEEVFQVRLMVRFI